MPITRQVAAIAPHFINSTHGKTSFIKVVTRGIDEFVDYKTITVNPVEDSENAGLKFAVTVVKYRSHKTQAVLKLEAINPPKSLTTLNVSLTPTDGLLSITLVDSAVEAKIVDLPVTYVNETL